ncbi:unnamed protein product, partial [Heterotrigona itama]
FITLEDVQISILMPLERIVQISNTAYYFSRVRTHKDKLSITAHIIPITWSNSATRTKHNRFTPSGKIGRKSRACKVLP